jgi:predicted nucleotidyltransferase
MCDKEDMNAATQHPPALDERVREAIRRVLAAAPPGSRVILFGSHARGEARPDSDVDLLVVEPHVQDAVAEMVRLSKAIRPLHVPVDVLVSSAERFTYWCDTRNTIYYLAAREGHSFDAGSPP